jgi:hypothetical protein
MATNPYMQAGRGIGAKNEQNLIRDLIDESIQFTGMDVHYIPRKIANFDAIFGEDNTSYFDQFVTIEVYFESTEKFGGMDDYMSKLGLRTNEEANFRVSKRRWEELIGSTGITQNTIRPNEGDLLYVPFDNNIFEIRRVSMKDPFYILNDFYSYTLECSLFQYGSERITADIPEMIDQIPTSLDNLLYPSIVGVGENLTVDPTTQELASAGITTVDYDTANKDLHSENATIANFTESNPFGLSNQ